MCFVMFVAVSFLLWQNSQVTSCTEYRCVTYHYIQASKGRPLYKSVSVSHSWLSIWQLCWHVIMFLWHTGLLTLSHGDNSRSHHSTCDSYTAAALKTRVSTDTFTHRHTDRLQDWTSQYFLTRPSRHAVKRDCPSEQTLYTASQSGPVSSSDVSYSSLIKKHEPSPGTDRQEHVSVRSVTINVTTIYFCLL